MMNECPVCFVPIGACEHTAHLLMRGLRELPKCGICGEYDHSEDAHDDDYEGQQTTV